jgi:Ser/Thr protein kinase RdoA (MazF antagonist)
VIDPAELLAAVAPDRTVEATETVARGNHKRTTRVTFADGDRAVLQQSSDADALETEVALVAAVADRTAVPVPAVLASDTRDGDGYALFERAPGSDLHEVFSTLAPARQQAIARTFGRSLAALHGAFRFERCGAVTAAGEGLTATGPDDCAAWLGTHAREGVAALPSAFDAQRDRLLAAFETVPVPEGPPRLYPWDLRPGNALVADGSVTAVVDWGGPLSAPLGVALAKTEHLVAEWYAADPAPLAEALRGGYRSVRPLPAVPDEYRLLAVVRSAVDSRGEVTRPRYPELTGADAVAFHRERIDRLL